MSLNNKGESCARCHAYLFSEDDVVYCPICGAPHHRECYNALGHCALEEFHGTEKEYSKEKQAQIKESVEQKPQNTPSPDDKITCTLCGEKFDNSLHRCPKCGTPAGGVYGFFDFLGGVPADTDIGEGITAEDAKKFVLANPQRYIPKFALLNENSKASWNWMAFLFPAPWLISRKMYKGGIFAGIFTIMATLLSYPLNLILYRLGLDEIRTYSEVVRQIMEYLPQINIFIIIAALLGLVAELSTRIVCGIYADYWYKQYTISSIKKIRQESLDQDADFRKKGGVNFFLFMIGFMVLQYIPMIIASFF